MPTVLLVDDDEAFSYATTKALEGAGLRVISAGDGLSALRTIDNEPIDLLLADIRLPGGQPHGIALARMTGRRRRGLPVLLMTQYPDLAEEADQPEKVLLKDAGIDAIVAEVKAALGRGSSTA